MGKSYFTPQISKVLYAIAIMLMVGEHIFYSDRFQGYIALRPYKGIALGTYLSLYASCVSIYSFITGYGLKQKLKESISLKERYCWTGNKLIKFMTNYWAVFIPAVLIGIFSGGVHCSYVEILWNGLGISHSINYEWWYVRFYVIVLCLYPFMDWIHCMLKKKMTFIDGVIVISCITITTIPALHTRFIYNMIMTIVGYECAEIGVYKLKPASGLWGWIIVSVIYPIKWFLVLFLDKYSHNVLDVILVPLMVYGVICIYNSSFIKKGNWFACRWCLNLLSRYSMMIWLIHSFLIYYYAHDVMLRVKYGILIYLLTIIISAGIGVLINYMKGIGRFCFRKRHKRLK